MKPTKIQQKRILVVDDEQAVRASTHMLLEIDGHTVFDAESGAEALERVQSGGIDLVITDFRMPGMTGGELTSQIKQIAPTTAVIILTAWPQDVAPETPADAVVAKPYTLDSLRQALAQAARSK